MPKDTAQMHSIAAYYVFVANDLASEGRTSRHQLTVARPSLAARVVLAVAAFVRTGQRAASQPA